MLAKKTGWLIMRIVEGAAVRLVLQQRRAGDAEELESHADAFAHRASAPVCGLPFENRISASWRPGVA